jgi:molybdopterin/thiamine biosynthesis adenylyltransferase
MTPDHLTGEEMERYDRQLLIKGIGNDGQAKIKKATVGIVGMGGLGSPVSTYLAAAGIGELIIIDDQIVEASNLNRQTLHWQDDLEESRPKVVSAANKLAAMNPGLKVKKHSKRIVQKNIAALLGGADILVDCTDNFETRMVLNEFAIDQAKPLVHGAVESLHGQVTTVLAGSTACLACIFPRPPGRKTSVPVLGSAAGMIGSIQATEVIKLITGLGEPLFGKLLVVDLSNNCFETICIERDPNCPVCGHVKKGVSHK